MAKNFKKLNFKIINFKTINGGLRVAFSFNPAGRHFYKEISYEA